MLRLSALLAGLAVFGRQAWASDLEFDVPHSFSVEDAKARMELLFQYWGTRFGVTHHWDGNVATVEGHVFGIDASGRLVVEPKRVHGVGKDPGLLFRGIGFRYVDKKLRKYLHPNWQEP
jgi:hypothetical protein